MTRKEFFDKLKAGAKWDVGVSIARTNPLPLDANEIFESIDLMETYIKSNALAYPGQIVVVLGETETAAYLVQTVGGEGKGYLKLASTSGSGDVGDQLTKLATRIATVEGYFDNGIAKSAKEAESDTLGNVISTTYATKAELQAAVTGSVQYLDTVANDAAVSALQPNSKGDFARASANFTLSAANSSTGAAVSIHAGDLLICASIGTPNTWTISHGGEEGVVSISNGTGIAVDNSNPASPTISLTTDYVNEIAKITNKVDKEEGKGLSTNDYTTAEKTKLAGLTKITVDPDLTATGTNPVQGKAIYDTIAALESKVDTKAEEGDLIAGLAIKLDAADYIVDDALDNTSEHPVQNKVVYTATENLRQAIAEKADDADTKTALSKKVDKTAGTTFALSESRSEILISAPERLDSESQNYQFNFIGVSFNTDQGGETNVTIDSAKDSVTGGIKTGFTADSAAKKYAVELDANGKAYVSVPWVNTTYSAATASALGLVKIGYSGSGKNYAVQLDNNNKAYVSVPWTDTKYTLPTAELNTLGGIKLKYAAMTAEAVINKETTKEDRFYAINVDKNGYAFVNIPWDFRPIIVNNTSIDSMAPMNFINGANISLELAHNANEEITINHTGPGSASQTTTETKADSSLVEDGGTVAFGKEFYVPSFGIDANGHTRDLKMTKYSLPTPKTYSLPIATATVLGGIKSGNQNNNFVAGSGGEDQTGNVPNYEAEVVVHSSTGKATVNLEAMAGPEIQWSIIAGQTVLGIQEVSTDKLVPGEKILVLNGGGAAD